VVVGGRGKGVWFWLDCGGGGRREFMLNF